MTQYNTKWKPIKLGDKNSPHQISSTAVSSDWFNQMVDMAGTRESRLMKYHEADTESVEISRALDIITEDITACNADRTRHGLSFEISYPDDSKIKRTIVKMIEDALGVWNKRTGFKYKLFQYVRRVVRDGSLFLLKEMDGSLTELKSEQITGYVLDKNDGHTVTHYIYDPSIVPIEDRAIRRQSIRSTNATQTSKVFIPVSELVVLKIGEGPFGKSLVDPVYKIYKQLRLLEEAMIVYRVVRAPERRVYYIDVGQLSGNKRNAAIEKQRISLTQKRIADKAKGSVEVTYDPHSTQEDIFIPTNSTGKGSRVETLPGGTSLGETGDLEYLMRKLNKGLRVPASMTDPENDNTQPQFSDMRVGQTYQVEMRYMGHVSRLAAQLEPVFEENFVEFIRLRGILKPRDMQFSLIESQSFSAYKDIELNQSRLNVLGSTLQIVGLSKRVAMQKYLDMEHDELSYNEEQMLMEKGLTKEEIKSLEPNEVYNIVYGDGRLGDKVGLPVVDQTTMY